MDISIRKIRVLFKKDFVDFMKNTAISLSCLMPLFFAILYRFVFDDPGIGPAILLNMVLGLNLSLVSVMLPATTIAEEKEKFTLRTLMLSNVSGFEVFTAKLLVTSVFMLITNVLIYVVAGAQAAHLPAYILIVLIGSAPLILLGAAVGILARDQMNASVYEIPVMLLFLLPTIFGELNKTFSAISSFTPCHAVIQAVKNLLEGELMSADTLFRVGVMIAWLIIAAVALVYLYKKKGTDN